MSENKPPGAVLLAYQGRQEATKRREKTMADTHGGHRIS
jgi:hypothetical protein